MLSQDSEYRLAKLFNGIAEAEISIEATRQVLGEHQDFEPFSIFKALDKSQNSYLSAYDLLTFLRQNSVVISELEAFSVLKNLDHNQDSKVSYSDFIESALPATRPSLKSIATSRPPKIHISYEVEYSLVKLFQKELDFIRNVDFNRANLTSKFDYNNRAAFELLDPKSLGYISRYFLLEFMRLNRFRATEAEIDAIFRRVDRDSDGKINYKEFLELMTKESELGGRSYSPSVYDRRSSPLRSGDRLGQSLRQDEFRVTFRDSPRRSSPLRSGNKFAQTMNLGKFTNSVKRSSPLRSIINYERNPVKSSSLRNSVNFAQTTRESFRDSGRRSSPLRQSFRPSESLSSFRSFQRASSPLRRSISPRNDPINQGSITDRSESFRFSQPLRKSFDGRSVSPSYRNSVSPRNDISRISLGSSSINPYRTFGSSVESPRLTSSYRESKNVIENIHLLRVLNEQILLDRQAAAHLKDLALKSDFTLVDAFKLFDSRGYGYLTKNDLESILKSLGIYPTEEELYLLFSDYDRDEDGRLRYSDLCEMLAPKEHDYLSLIQNRSRSNHKDVFSRETNIQLSKTLRTLISNENFAEKLRHEISKRPEFNATEAFSSLDYNGNGFISLDEFRKFLAENGKFPSDFDLIGLMNRYDRNKDGRVSFTEFVKEITPKLSRKPY